MVPAVAAGRLTHCARRLVGGGAGLVLAMAAAPGRKLVNLCGPLLQIRVHLKWSFFAFDSFSGAWRRQPCCARVVLDWLLIRYRRCTLLVQPDQNKIISCLEFRHFRVCMWEASAAKPTPHPSPRLLEGRRFRTN